MKLEIGSLVTFSYPAVHQQGTRAHDKYPQVLILHPNWEGLLHGLNFNYLSNDEINTIRMILDPLFEMQQREALKRKNPRAFQELENIIGGHISGTSGPHGRIVQINSPRAFYLNVIKPFISTRGWDPYRKYRLDKMTNIRLLQTSSHMTGKDSYAQYQSQQQSAIQKAQQPQSKSPFTWFKDKFQNMKGSQMPRFKRRDDGEEE